MKQPETGGKGLSRRRLIEVAGSAALIAGAVAVWRVALGGTGTAEAGAITVYKSPWCGCCGEWIEHMRANGFAVTVHEVEDVAPFKARYGVPAALESCHTASVDGYVIEGHVPADLVERLLAERPPVRGLSAPGMPAGSPGMESAGREPYDIVAFDAQGRTSIYARR